MKSFTSAEIKQYRTLKFHLSPGEVLRKPSQAIDFVNQRGFILFWPDPKMELPNLWNAVAGDRPVPDDHDDPGHISWNWKDSLLDKRVWYYARVIRQRNTMISLELIPYFYALSPNFGSPMDDMQDQYLRGELPLEAKLIFEALMDKGPLDTISLRKEAHLTSTSSNQPFQRALNLLQRDLKLLPTGITEAGAWHYAFRYDLTHRYIPDLLESAHEIDEFSARSKLISALLNSVGAATARQIASVFSWPLELTLKHLNKHSGVDWESCVVPQKESSTPGFCSLEFLQSVKIK